MQIKLTVETSRYSDNPTKRWAYGADYWEEDIEIEVPDGTDVDALEDWELLELASPGSDIGCIKCGWTGEEWLSVSGGDGWTGKPCPHCVDLAKEPRL